MNDKGVSPLKEYYEEYWKYRIAKGRLHTTKGMWIPHRIRLAVDMITNDFQRRRAVSSRLLDVGCGEGTIGKLISKYFRGDTEKKLLLIGCDISTSALQTARSHYGEVFNIDIEKDAFPDKFQTHEFDYIVLLDVLEHLVRPGIALAKCYSILKSNGILVTSFPNIAWYSYRIDLLRGHFPSDYLFGPGDHIQQFTLFSFKALLRGSGFKVETIDGQFILPFFFRPRRLFLRLCKRLPNLFGYQLVLKARKAYKPFVQKGQQYQT